MVKQFLPALAFIILLSSCSTFKPLNFTSNKQLSASEESVAPSNAKFIEEISVTPQMAEVKTAQHDMGGIKKAKAVKTQNEVSKAEDNRKAIKETVTREEPQASVNLFANRTPSIESASSVQLKYSILLNTEVESLPSRSLLESVDEWYGVRYRVGGNTKTGIDCSGLTVAVYAAVYGMMIPRVSREQYRISRKISTTELQEGDLVFFNTNGRGVSHVGVYLGNNKFIHASVSKGVMVNDLFEPYYLKRFVGAGRMDDKQAVASN